LRGGLAPLHLAYQLAHSLRLAGQFIHRPRGFAHACAVWPDISLTRSIDRVISSLVADCCSLAAAMALT